MHKQVNNLAECLQAILEQQENMCQGKGGKIEPKKCASPCALEGSEKLPIPTHIAAAAWKKQ